MGHTNNPKYCKYHRVVSHLVEKCFVLKDIIIKVAKEGKILLDLDGTVESNYTAFTSTSLTLIKSQTPSKTPPLASTLGASDKHIQFGTIEPFHMPCLDPLNEAKIKGKLMNEDKSWAFVTRKKSRKKCDPKSQIIHTEKQYQKSNPRRPREKVIRNPSKEVHGDKLLQQRSNSLNTLHDFFPKSYFKMRTDGLRVEKSEACDEKSQDQTSKAFNKRACPYPSQVGDLALATRRPFNMLSKKSTLKWGGSYVVHEVGNGTYQIDDKDGQMVSPIKAK